MKHQMQLEEMFGRSGQSFLPIYHGQTFHPVCYWSKSLQKFAAPRISEAKRGLENLAWLQRKVCSSCLFCQSSLQVFDGETANPWVATIAHRAKIAYAHAWRE